MPKNKVIRILRLIEYTGPEDLVREQVRASVHGEKLLPNGVMIKGVTLGEPLIEGYPNFSHKEIGHANNRTEVEREDEPVTKEINVSALEWSGVGRRSRRGVPESAGEIPPLPGAVPPQGD